MYNCVRINLRGRMMKRHLMIGTAAIVLSGLFTNCSHDMDSGSSDVEKSIQEKYEDAFKTRFGTPASTQTWGFSDKVGTRGQTNPQRSDIDCPYDDAWVAEYLKTAKEPASLNTYDDVDNRYFVEEQDSMKVVIKEEEIIPPVMPEYTWGEKVNFIIENPDYKPTTEETSSSTDEIVVTKEDLDFYDENCRPVVEFEFKDKDKEDYAEVDSFINIFLNAYEKIQADETRKDWLTVTTEPVLTDTIPEEAYWQEYIPAHWVEDEDFVLNFKITKDYKGTIAVASTDGYESEGDNYTNVKKDPYYARTILVKGATWTVDAAQKIGSGGIVIIGDGGVLDVSADCILSFVEHARIVILKGGKLQGNGWVIANNGNNPGEENYNLGTIYVRKFSLNYGKFYNYGLFHAGIYGTGTNENCFYNNGIAIADATSEGGYSLSANAKIVNACQWWCKNHMRVRNIEMASGSYMFVEGELTISNFTGGAIGDDAYVGMAANSFIECGSLNNDNANWTGPKEGYAVVKTGQLSSLKWKGDFGYPLDYGYFENNIYMELGDGTNDPGGDGNHQNDNEEAYPYRAGWKFEHILANGLNNGTIIRGNGNVRLIEAGDTEIIPADDDFELGVKGCTPGYKGDLSETPVDPGEDEDKNYEAIRVIAEDLNVSTNSQTKFDFNGVVFDVRRYTSGEKQGTVEIVLRAAGTTQNLFVDDKEIHNLFNVPQNTMVNVNAEAKGLRGVTKDPVIFTPSNYSGSTIREIAASIKVNIVKDGTPYQLTANTGQVASKIAVGDDYQWCDEQQDIDAKYSKTDGTSLFKEYVQGRLNNDWYKSK